jgi:hypothetical protein
MENNKIYCGNGKAFGQYGGVNISICVDDIPPQYIKKSEKNGKRYISLKVNQKREADQWGKTHSVEVDTWEPNQNNGQQGFNQQGGQQQQQQNLGGPQTPPPAQQVTNDDPFGGFNEKDDLPF